MVTFSPCQQSLCPLVTDSERENLSTLNGSEYGFIDLDEDPIPPIPAPEETVNSVRNEISVVTDSIQSSAIGSKNSSISSKIDSPQGSFKSIRNSSAEAKVKVICEIEYWRAPTTCRSFITNDVLQTHVCVALNISKFRIVQTLIGERVEYLVNASVGDRELESWKTFEDFKQLADACREHSRFLERYISSVTNTRCPSVVPLAGTLEAWWQVESNRPWWSSPTKPAYIAKELPRIKDFMDTFLFEVANLQILFEFMSN